MMHTLDSLQGPEEIHEEDEEELAIRLYNEQHEHKDEQGNDLAEVGALGKEWVKNQNEAEGYRTNEDAMWDDVQIRTLEDLFA